MIQLGDRSCNSCLLRNGLPSPPWFWTMIFPIPFKILTIWMRDLMVANRLLVTTSDSLIILAVTYSVTLILKFDLSLILT